METQYKFYFNKEKSKKKIIKNVLILFASLILNFIVLYYLKSTTLTLISMGFVPVFFLYFSFRAWKQFNYADSIIQVDSNKIVFKKMDFFLNINETEIKIEDIKTIGTDVRMKGDSVISESMSLVMYNSDKFKFQINEFDLSHKELYRIIKELNPDAKLIDVGEFAYE